MEPGFKIKSSCWDGEYSFKCSSDNFGRYQGCGVHASDDIEYPGEISGTANFIGIAISVEGTCGGGFKSMFDCGEGATLKSPSTAGELGPLLYAETRIY